MDKKIAYKPVDQFENRCLYNSGGYLICKRTKTTQCNFYVVPRNKFIQSW